MTVQDLKDAVVYLGVHSQQLETQLTNAQTQLNNVSQAYNKLQKDYDKLKLTAPKEDETRNDDVE